MYLRLQDLAAMTGAQLATAIAAIPSGARLSNF